MLVRKSLFLFMAFLGLNFTYAFKGFKRTTYSLPETHSYLPPSFSSLDDLPNPWFLKPNDSNDGQMAIHDLNHLYYQLADFLNLSRSRKYQNGKNQKELQQKLELMASQFINTLAQLDLNFSKEFKQSPCYKFVKDEHASYLREIFSLCQSSLFDELGRHQLPVNFRDDVKESVAQLEKNGALRPSKFFRVMKKISKGIQSAFNESLTYFRNCPGEEGAEAGQERRAAEEKGPFIKGLSTMNACLEGFPTENQADHPMFTTQGVFREPAGGEEKKRFYAELLKLKDRKKVKELCENIFQKNPKLGANILGKLLGDHPLVNPIKQNTSANDLIEEYKNLKGERLEVLTRFQQLTKTMVKFQNRTMTTMSNLSILIAPNLIPIAESEKRNAELIGKTFTLQGDVFNALFNDSPNN